jgi:hypothetical protein
MADQQILHFLVNPAATSFVYPGIIIRPEQQVLLSLEAVAALDMHPNFRSRTKERIDFMKNLPWIARLNRNRNAPPAYIIIVGWIAENALSGTYGRVPAEREFRF